MKKIIWVLVFSVLLMMVTLGALAEMIPVGQESLYDIERHYMLQDGDRLHCLSISYDWEWTSRENQMIHFTMEANCHELRDGVFVPCESHCADRWFIEETCDYASKPQNPDLNGIAITPDAVTYMIDPYDVVYRWAPDEEDPWQYQCTLDTSLNPYEIRAMDGYYAEDGVLYAVYNTVTATGSVGEGIAIAYSLETGEGEVLCTLPVMLEVYPAGENKLLIVGNPDPSNYINNILYDRVTGKSIKYVESKTLDKLASDGHGGWYSAHWDALYHIHGDGKLEEIVKLPSSDGWRYITLSTDKKTAYIYLSGYKDGYMYVYPLEGGAEDKDLKLVMAGSLNEFSWNHDFLPDLKGFYAEVPGVEVTTADYPGNFDEIAVELLTGSDRVDILVVECSSGNIQSLLDKGYYVDLSDVEGVADYLNSLYPVWREPCMSGDEIAAIPVTARNWKTFLRNLTLWEEEALGPVPTTYDELFDAIWDWNERDILDMGYPLFYKGFSSFDRLAYRIVQDYIGLRMREGTPIVFEDETLLHLLGRLEELRPILDAHDAKNPSGDALMPEGGVLTAIVHSGIYVDSLYADRATLPLGITDAQDAVESVYYTVLILNPNSPRIELAKQFLSYVATHPSAWAQCVLIEGMPHGIREPGYEDATERYEQLMPELTEQLTVAMRESDDAVSQNLENQIGKLTKDYLYEWMVHPYAANLLYQVLPYFTVATSDGYGFLEKRCDDLMDMFCKDQMDSLTLVRRLDDRMQMMLREGIE